jgi:hypothetical protein
MFLRNSVLMNDFSEVDYGARCLADAYVSDVGERLKSVLKRIDKDLPAKLESEHNALLFDVKNETYLISISEHLGGLEDELGRLSMWRAYGQRNGVAFVFNNRPFLTESGALKAYSSPVEYATPAEFKQLFEEVVAGVEANAEELQKIGAGFVHEWLVGTFRAALQSTKHPAFREELEWRVIYSPSILVRRNEMTQQQLERVPTEIRSIAGIPQRIFAIPFQNYPEDGFMGATIPELVDRVLIGPSTDAYAIAQAFVAELEDAGVSNAHQKIHVTGVPLRG